jgi:hypothetical protein
MEYEKERHKQVSFYFLSFLLCPVSALSSIFTFFAVVSFLGKASFFIYKHLRETDTTTTTKKTY